MSLFKCILYFKEIEKDYERFLVQSKKTIFDVNVALANLEFHVHVTNAMVSSRREVICSRTWKKSMRINYDTNLKEVGFVFQPKNSLEGANLSSKRPQLEGHSWSSSIGNEQSMHIPSIP